MATDVVVVVVVDAAVALTPPIDESDCDEFDLGRFVVDGAFHDAIDDDTVVVVGESCVDKRDFGDDDNCVMRGGDADVVLVDVAWPTRGDVELSFVDCASASTSAASRSATPARGK